MRFRNSPLVLVALSCLTMAACTRKGDDTPKIDSENSISISRNSAPVEEAQKLEPGTSLFTYTKPSQPSTSNFKPARLIDPVVIPQGRIIVKQKQEVPARMDTEILFIGRQIDGMPEGAQADGSDYFRHPRTGKLYRKLRVGDEVEKGETIILLDDSQASAEVAKLQASLEAAKSEAAGKEKLVEATKNAWQIEVEARQSKLQILRSKAQYDNAVAEYNTAMSRIQEVSGELKKAERGLEMYHVSAAMSGVVDKVYMQNGEAIKGTEPVIRLQELQVLRVEGYLPQEEAELLNKGMEVTLEPEFRQSPLVNHTAHRQPITAVSRGFNGVEPLFLSASEDRQVNVWNTRQLIKSLPHPVKVRAVDCTPPDAKEHLALTGADDGKIRIFDLTKLKQKPREFKEAHPAPILEVAFAPEGRYCATSDDMRNVIVWNVSTGEKLYHLPAVHRGPVTDLHFTPQGQLITVARDNTIGIWKVGAENARLEGDLIEHRAGELDQLDVSADGNHILFDREKGELHVLSLKDRHTEQVIRNVISSAHFTSFARISPDQHLVLTSSSQDGVLQLWRLPEVEQGHPTELRRLVIPIEGKPTCAEFIPPRKDRTGLVVVGTDTGHVHVWRMPTEEEINFDLKGTITYIDADVESDGRVRVWAEVENTVPGWFKPYAEGRDYFLRPGTAVNIVVRPEESQLDPMAKR